MTEKGSGKADTEDGGTDQPLTPDREFASDAASLEAQIRIRPCREADQDWLIRMYEAYDEGHRTLGTPPDTHDEIVAWLTHLRTTGANWVAVKDSTGVGHVTVAPISDERGELSVYVHPDHFDQGVGTALCRHAIETVADEYDALWLIVERSNSRAVSLFRKVGFEITDYYRNDIEMVYQFGD